MKFILFLLLNCCAFAAANDLIDRLDSPRFIVREQARQAIVRQGKSLIPALEQTIQTADTREKRLSAKKCLQQIRINYENQQLFWLSNACDTNKNVELAGFKEFYQQLEVDQNNFRIRRLYKEIWISWSDLLKEFFHPHRQDLFILRSEIIKRARISGPFGETRNIMFLFLCSIEPYPYKSSYISTMGNVAQRYALFQDEFDILQKKAIRRIEELE